MPIHSSSRITPYVTGLFLGILVAMPPVRGYLRVILSTISYSHHTFFLSCVFGMLSGLLWPRQVWRWSLAIYLGVIVGTMLAQYLWFPFTQPLGMWVLTHDTLVYFIEITRNTAPDIPYYFRNYLLTFPASLLGGLLGGWLRRRLGHQ